MPSLKDLKNRIGSVKSTQKITSAMKMVAAAKLRKAQENAEPSSNETNVNSENDADVVDAEYKEVNNDKK